MWQVKYVRNVFKCFLGVLKSPTLETSHLACKLALNSSLTANWSATLGIETEIWHHWLEPVLLLAAVEELGSYARSFFNESTVYLPETETAKQ